MIIEASKMLKCMMLKGTKYQDLVAIGILVLPKICQVSKMSIEEKYQLLPKKAQLKSEK